MKEKKYKDDWIVEVSLDETTGREKRTPVYQGEWYCLSQQVRKKIIWSSGICFALVLLGWILYFAMDFPGTRRIYVFLPMGCVIFPIVYWAMGLFAMLRAPERMTRLQKEKSIGRMIHCAVGTAVLCMIAVVGEIILILTENMIHEEGWGMVLIFGVAMVSIAAGRLIRKYSV